ncbi:putative receptor-like protein kinase At3g47110 [Salvia splendens]|uniref:putative receptor-like protein kinase At3g47110 n=1 Tax=Salvia splendens TaxID=180675 RepID=UPI001C2748A0|nr:putative receptor-like protein kinase At3g47110 [Salvia splendens]
MLGGELNLHRYASSALPHGLMEIIDPQLQIGGFNVEFIAMVLDDSEDKIVAFKVLNLDVRGASKTFMAECRALGYIRHRNLVKLVSVCDIMDYKGNEFKALVYYFKFNGSLVKWLHNNMEESGRF